MPIRHRAYLLGCDTQSKAYTQLGNRFLQNSNVFINLNLYNIIMTSERKKHRNKLEFGWVTLSYVLCTMGDHSALSIRYLVGK